ncbi:BioY-domain-containing protein [Gonapodya prolifera JEL478]|uniref:BioY-domain-containing protein n=1 Tax=Gonapodya prolifera (strain JEL478) TaxID=1344416 RepID=A0A139AV44_GONPJ|nr:BioY-domain-containing protein [Gonapodya prolifera JEL478]|eukprot:KXS20616.1 BioY-domain-containing protein [Gonapodya prolifera JEL478]
MELLGTRRIRVLPQFSSKTISFPVSGPKITVETLRRRIFHNYQELVESPENASLLGCDGQPLPDDAELDQYLTDETSVVRLELKRQPTYFSYVSRVLDHIPFAKYTVPVLLWAVSVLFIAASAQMSFYLPWDTDKTVPVTMQTFAILFIGTLAGPVWGFVVPFTYLLAGIAGAPFFAGQRSGWASFSGATCGYLISYPIAGCLCGALTVFRGFDKRFITTAATMVLGNIVIYLIGATWLGVKLGSASRAMTAGVLPFLPGDAVKIVIATALVPVGWKFLYFRERQNVEVDVEADK